MSTGRFGRLVCRGKEIRWFVSGGCILGVMIAGTACARLNMPGRAFHGNPKPSSPREKAVAEALRGDVEALAGSIGARSLYRLESLNAAADWLEAQPKDAGYQVHPQTFDVARELEKAGYRTTSPQFPNQGECRNLEVEIRGVTRPDEIVVVGAHYDTIQGSPGADDNASGCAVALALARSFAGKAPDRTLRFVWFVNEEPPFFGGAAMGSLQYARRSRERGERIVAMLSLETMGYYTSEKRSQRFPYFLDLFYPNRGNFVGFVTNGASRKLLRQVVASFGRHAEFPSYGAAVPDWITAAAWSDHWAFWEQGYPALMVTDTAFYRNPHYHTENDTPETISYDSLARIVIGLEGVVEDLVGGAAW